MSTSGARHKKTRCAGIDPCIGRTHGGKNTKVHALVNGRGLAVALSLSAGNREDFDEALPLLAQLPDLCGSNVLGDRAYGTRKIREYLHEHQASYTIPPSKNMKDQWSYDKEVYKHRNQVERFFCRLKEFRRVCTRYDKRADSFFAFTLIAAISISFAILHI